MIENLFRFPLHADILVYPKEIYVGNTGLNISIHDGIPYKGYEQLFLPDKFDWLNPKPDPKLSLKYSLIYPYALYHLATNWKDENKVLRGYTNTWMNNFRKKLLGEEIYQSKISTISNRYEYILDLESLKKNTPIIEKLQKMSDRCERENYLMSTP